MECARIYPGLIPLTLGLEVDDGRQPCKQSSRMLDVVCYTGGGGAVAILDRKLEGGDNDQCTQGTEGVTFQDTKYSHPLYSSGGSCLGADVHVEM